MSPEDLAAKHPCLYHLTDPVALPGILRHGLLPTSSLLSLFEVPQADRVAIERRRRSAGVPITHPIHGTAVITDNLPLSETALTSCLDDGLSSEDWLLLLNQRVFFWADERSLDIHRGARFNRGRERLVLVLDTLGLVRRHYQRVELTAINTGSTLRKPARRGLATFAPMHRHSYEEWQRLRDKQRVRGNQRLRCKKDRLKEVAVVDGVDDISNHLVRHYLTPPIV